MVIALEGLPGAGKTTTAGLVADRLGAATLRETTGDHPFLQQVYDDIDRDDFTVELTFLVVHANPYRRLSRDGLTVCDFSPAKDILFAEDMLSGDDLRLFTQTYAHVYRDHPLPDVAIYLDASPALCHDRVQERLRSDPSRSFELGMTLERLERMRARYVSAMELSAHFFGHRELSVPITPEQSPDEVVDAVVTALDTHGVLAA